MRAYTEHGESQEQWEAAASQNNALATASKAAAAGTRHFITDILASYSTSGTSGLLQVKRGTTVILEHYVHGAAAIRLASPIRGNVNEAVSVELAASGTAGVLGKVNLVGYSRPGA